ncbi:MAG: ABC transporter ATP-binding protein [bacterium]
MVVISELSKKYGKVTAVDSFSCEVRRGEVYALVGPDGAGKTTIIRSLCHLLGFDAGRVLIDGHDVDRDFDRIKPLLGYMPQVFSLYPDLSVEENLVFFAGIYGVTGREYRHKRDYLYRFSNLEPFARRRAGALSGGMKQKLALSCALMHDPQLLLLDEPTAGVDPLSRRQFWEILDNLRREGVTIMVSTPYMDEVARADRACFVFNGRKLAEGTPAELTAMFDGRVYFLDVAPDRRLVDHINSVGELHAERFGAGLHIYADSRTTTFDLQKKLKQLDIDPDHLTPVVADLEDTFIQLMGAGS